MGDSNESVTAAEPAGTAQVKPVTKKKPAARKKNEVKKMPPYNVVLLDDDEHTYAYVIEMMMVVFGYSPEKGLELAKCVDTTGRAVVKTTHKELAELKRDQIVSYGADIRMSNSHCGMAAVVEPAES